MATALDPYMTLDEIAAETRMSHGFVLKQVTSGAMRGIRAGRLWRVRRSAFKQWEYDQNPASDPNLIAAGVGIPRGQ